MQAICAYPAPNAKDLVETRPLDGLRINSPFGGCGCSLNTLATSEESLAVLDVPLTAVGPWGQLTQRISSCWPV